MKNDNVLNSDEFKIRFDKNGYIEKVEILKQRKDQAKIYQSSCWRSRILSLVDNEVFEKIHDLDDDSLMSELGITRKEFSEATSDTFDKVSNYLSNKEIKLQ